MSISPPRIVTAVEFWNAFVNSADRHRDKLIGFGGAWTGAMYDVLHDVQKNALQLWCSCEKPSDEHVGRKGESLEIDFMWFEVASGEYAPPVVAIEHENDWGLKGAMKDLWRVSNICAPLRVFFGYAANAKKLQPKEAALLDLSRSSRRLPGGEDLLVLRHRDMAQGEFKGVRVTDRGVKALPWEP